MRIILFLSLCVLIGVYIGGPIVDPDLWWHITAGRWILAHGQIPTVDLWNEFGVSRPWRAYSWSSEILFAFIDQHAGMHGLMALQILTGIGIAVALAVSCSRIASDWFMGTLLGLFATLATFNHFTLRPQSFIWILFGLLLWVADDIDRHGLSRGRMVAVWALFALWANTHLSAILGLAAIGSWMWRRDQGPVLLWVLAVALLGTITTPYVGGEWLTFFSKVDHPLQHRSITEFQPAQLASYSTAYLLLALALLGFFLHEQPRRVSIGRALGAVAFVGAGVAVVKFLPMAVIYLVALIARLWRDGERRFGDLGEAFERLRVGFAWMPRQGVSFLCLSLSVVLGANLWAKPVARSMVPVDAMDFIQEQHLPLPLLHTFGDGGYVMYRYSDAQGDPGYLVPIDGRTNVSPAPILAMHDLLLKGAVNWRDLFDVVMPKTVLWRRGGVLNTLLFETGEWCLVYVTPGSSGNRHTVFVRRDALPADSALRCLPREVLRDRVEEKPHKSADESAVDANVL